MYSWRRWTANAASRPPIFFEALANAGVALGLPAELVKALAAQTAFGAASLQVQPQADVVELRTALTSPNGTAAAAIVRFEQEQALRQLVESCTFPADSYTSIVLV